MKNIIRFNDLTTMECSGFTPTLIDNVDALIIEFHYENFIDMNEHSVAIYRKFKDEFALKKLELVDEQGNAVSAAYTGFGDAKLSTQTPDSGSHTKDYIVFVQLKKTDGHRSKNKRIKYCSGANARKDRPGNGFL